jgi:GalNAc-alpha-(1->4)-GalNAc-alpha-(1->3)-diNAcBac-PP-undecaprenol alpha-1,4-N-acetyl-D-galactosaminyltransferase
MQKKNNILFVSPTLSGGGAERVLTNMANYWAEKGRKVTIAVIISEEINYTIHTNIKVIGLDTYKVSTHFIQGLIANIKRIRRLRRIIKQTKPDTIISFTTMCNIVAYFAKIGLPIPLVISERTNPLAYPLNAVWEKLKKIAYNNADALVLQTHGVQKLYANYSTPQYIIRNPLILPPSISFIESYRSKVIVTVGRLDAFKNVRFLVNAFAKTGQKDWSLWIIGRDAGEQYLIEQDIKTLGLTDQIKFLGNQKNVFEHLAKASIFATASRVEGYPNALLEAMAIGLPVVSTDCDFGPSEIIEEGVNGFLIQLDDLDTFAQKLHLLMRDNDLRQKMGQNASKTRETHSLSEIIKHWDGLIEPL